VIEGAIRARGTSAAQPGGDEAGQRRRERHRAGSGPERITVTQAARGVADAARRLANTPTRSNESDLRGCRRAKHRSEAGERSQMGWAFVREDVWASRMALLPSTRPDPRARGGPPSTTRFDERGDGSVGKRRGGARAQQGSGENRRRARARRNGRRRRVRRRERSECTAQCDRTRCPQGRTEPARSASAQWTTGPVLRLWRTSPSLTPWPRRNLETCDLSRLLVGDENRSDSAAAPDLSRQSRSLPISRADDFPET
jgi:hypothetical protein